MLDVLCVARPCMCLSLFLSLQEIQERHKLEIAEIERVAAEVSCGWWRSMLMTGDCGEASPARQAACRGPTLVGRKLQKFKHQQEVATESQGVN